MGRLETILVAVDYSDCSLNALLFAAGLAECHGAGLHVVHVVDRLVLQDLSEAMGNSLNEAIRLVRGPSLPDRVVALDLAGLSIVALVATYSIESHEPVLVRAATVLALISFLATICFAYYIQRKGIE